MVNSAPNSPADPSAASAQTCQRMCQHFVRTQRNFPFPKASERGAERSSSFTEPLTLEQGDSPEEKQLPSGSAVG